MKNKHKNLIKIMAIGMAIPFLGSCHGAHTGMRGGHTQGNLSNNHAAEPSLHKDNKSNLDRTRIELQLELELAQKIAEVMDMFMYIRTEKTTKPYKKLIVPLALGGIGIIGLAMIPRIVLPPDFENSFGGSAFGSPLFDTASNAIKLATESSLRQLDSFYNETMSGTKQAPFKVDDNDLTTKLHVIRDSCYMRDYDCYNTQVDTLNDIQRSLDDTVRDANKMLRHRVTQWVALNKQWYDLSKAQMNTVKNTVTNTVNKIVSDTAINVSNIYQGVTQSCNLSMVQRNVGSICTILAGAVGVAVTAAVCHIWPNSTKKLSDETLTTLKEKTIELYQEAQNAPLDDNSLIALREKLKKLFRRTAELTDDLTAEDKLKVNTEELRELYSKVDSVFQASKTKRSPHCQTLLYCKIRIDNTLGGLGAPLVKDI